MIARREIFMLSKSRDKLRSSRQLVPRGATITSEELHREIKGIVSDAPGTIFPSTTTTKVVLENLNGLMDRSTRVLPSFLLFVVLPTLLSLLYLVAVASPQYESELSFTVQQGTKSPRAMSGIMALAAQVSGFSSTSQETYMVLEYLRSLDAIKDLGGAAFLEPIFARSGIDYLARMDKGLPAEEIHKYWGDKIIPELDTRSGIITLKVRAFSPEDAYGLASRLLNLSEDLINSVSQRSREKTLERVEGDLRRSLTLVKQSRDQLRDFQNAEGSINPSQDAEHLASILAELTLKRIEIETEIGVLLPQIKGDSPAIRVKREQSDALKKQIDALEARMTGLPQSDSSIAQKLVKYESLQADLQYYEKLYAISMSAYEQAREDVLKQQIFVIPTVKPSLAESSDYPNLFEVCVSIFLLSLSLWSIGILTASSIKDHRI